MQNVAARLPFTGGEFVLFDDATFQVVPEEPLRERHEQFAAEMDTTALKWGASLLVGLAAVGVAAYRKGWRPVGWTLFGLSGASALVARHLRNAAKEWDAVAFSPQPLSKVEIVPEADGSLGLAIAGSAATPPWTIRLEAGEYDRAAARTFLKSFERLRPIVPIGAE